MSKTEDLWDYRNHEHHKEGFVYYVYSGDYIRKEKTVQIHNKDLAGAVDKLFDAATGLKQPRVRLGVDADGRPYADVLGWIEMTPEDHGRREHLRAQKAQKSEEAAKAQHDRQTGQMKKHLENCIFCRREQGLD